MIQNFTVDEFTRQLWVRTGCCGAIQVRSVAHLNAYSLPTDINGVLKRLIRGIASDSDIIYLKTRMNVVNSEQARGG